MHYILFDILGLIADKKRYGSPKTEVAVTVQLLDYCNKNFKPSSHQLRYMEQQELNERERRGQREGSRKSEEQKRKISMDYCDTVQHCNPLWQHC